MLFLAEAQITELVGIRDALDVVEAALKEQGTGTATNLSRQRIRMPTGTLHLMAGALAGTGRFGFKAYTTFRGYIKFHVFLYDRDHGNLLAIMEGDRLGQLRTGAATGVATKYMTPPIASVLAIIGAGWQAQTQLRAICAVREIKQIRVYSRHAERREKFAAAMQEHVPAEIKAVETAQAAAEGADILVTATTAREPVLCGDWLAAGAHVNAIGSNTLVRREIDEAVVARSNFVCVDSREQARIESGDLLLPIEKGLLGWERVYELADVVAGRIPGRTSTQDITLFKSHGVAIEDIALAALVFERACEQRIGSQFPI